MSTKYHEYIQARAPRGKKNVFFTFVREDFLEKMAASELISYGSLRKCLWHNRLKVRLNGLRDYYATFMVHNVRIREEVDLLQGRVGKSMFMRDYFSPNVEDLRDRVLATADEMCMHSSSSIFSSQ